MKMPDPERMAQAFTDPYYLNVILQDERRFLVSEAKQHIKVVPLGTIAGDKRIIIDSRKAIVDDREAQDVQREALRVWREYQGHEKITSRLVLTAGPNEDNGEVKMQLDQLTEWTPKEETGRKVDGD
jgi:hypothetical protein